MAAEIEVPVPAISCPCDFRKGTGPKGVKRTCVILAKPKGNWKRANSKDCHRELKFASVEELYRSLKDIATFLEAASYWAAYFVGKVVTLVPQKVLRKKLLLLTAIWIYVTI